MFITSVGKTARAGGRGEPGVLATRNGLTFREDRNLKPALPAPVEKEAATAEE